MNNRSVIELVSTEFKKKKIPCVLIGGFALGFHKFQRTTMDIDFMISEVDLKLAQETLVNVGYKPYEKGEGLFVRFKSNSEELMDLDLVLVEPETLKEIMNQGIRGKVGNLELIVPKLEHLIAMKLHAIKNNPHRELNDLLDIVSLMRNNDIDPRSNKIKELCLKFGTAEVYEKIIRALS